MTKSLHPTDVEVGAKVRVRRNALGISQTSRATALGVIFLKVQKCENGKNRIGASRLRQLSKFLGVPILHFFEKSNGMMPVDRAGEGAEEGALIDFLSRDHGMKPNMALAAIKSPNLRRRVLGHKIDRRRRRHGVNE